MVGSEAKGSGAAYRASTCKSAMGSFERLDPQAFARVCAAVPEYVQTIRDAGRLAWIDAEVFDGYNAACLRELGQARYVDLWRAYTVGQIDSPVFGKLADGAMRVFGITPRGLFKLMGQAWTLTTRGYGVASTVVKSDTRATVRLEQVPPSGRLPTVVLSMHGSLRGLLEMAKTEGRVEMAAQAFEEEGWLEFEVDWA